jgi:hypothetical protein
VPRRIIRFNGWREAIPRSLSKDQNVSLQEVRGQPCIWSPPEIGNRPEDACVGLMGDSFWCALGVLTLADSVNFAGSITTNLQ